MKLRKSQLGISVGTIMIMVVVLGFVTMTFFKLFPAYMENMTIASSLEALENSDDPELVSVAGIRNALSRRFSINDVEVVGLGDVLIVRDGNDYSVDVDYEVRIPYISNIDLVLVFKNHADVSAR